MHGSCTQWHMATCRKYVWLTRKTIKALCMSPTAIWMGSKVITRWMLNIFGEQEHLEVNTGAEPEQVGHVFRITQNMWQCGSHNYIGKVTHNSLASSYNYTCQSCVWRGTLGQGYWYNNNWRAGNQWSNPFLSSLEPQKVVLKRCFGTRGISVCYLLWYIPLSMHFCGICAIRHMHLTWR